MLNGDQLGRMNATLRGIGLAVTTQRPFVGFLLKNWPLTVVAGLALYGRARERHKKGELNLFNTLGDAGLILSPLVGLALLNNLAQMERDRQAAGGAPPPVPGTPS